MENQYEIVMGLETHVRIKSETKMFCACRNAVELADEPNLHTCPYCMAFPWALPVLNERVIDLAVRAGQAMRCTVNETSIFDRKSYFYPDSPSGFQITQLFHPIVQHGVVRAHAGEEVKSFKIERMHIEADAGKLIHSGNKTLCDYNRAGSPLMEIVTEPDFRSKEDVIGYLEELQKLMRWCGASDADMEKGQLRCDVNISIRNRGETVLNNRVELKNINSFSAIWRAIDNEYKRQIKIVESGGKVPQETRGWDDEKGMSSSQRSKEDAMDYRYFPEPDLPPLMISKEFIEARAIGDLPIDRRLKYTDEFKLQPDDARILSASRDLSDFYEELVKLSGDAKKSCSYITTILFTIWGKEPNFFPDVRDVGHVINFVNRNELSSTNAKIVIEELYKSMNLWDGTKEWISALIDKLGLRQVSDTGALKAIAEKVLADNPGQVAEYKSGKENLFGFFVGQCMKASAGQGNPKMFTEILKGIL